MAPLAYLLVLMSIAHGIGLTDAGQYYYRTMEKRDCDYPGYAPDGFRQEITSISPIQVEAPASALAKIAGRGATGTKGLATAVEKAADKITKLKSLAKIVPGLSVVAGAFGFVEALNKVTPQDIINKVNEGFQKFVSEVNGRLDQTRDYVDQSIVTAIKNLAVNQLKTMENRWAHCLEETSDDELKRCQKTQVNLIHGGMSHFGHIDNVRDYPVLSLTTKECTKDKQICIFPFKYGSNLHSNCLNSGGSESWCATSVNADRTYKGWGNCGDQTCSGYQDPADPDKIPSKMLVKKIELKLPLFRMYATLRMMVTRLTADVYKNSDDIEDLKQYRRYLRNFKKAANESVRYAEWSNFWIKYKNCQVGKNVPYCGDLNSAWVKDCYQMLNPFVSTTKCWFKFIGGKINCDTNLWGKCKDVNQRGVRHEGPAWESNRWYREWCEGGYYVSGQRECSSAKGKSMWNEIFNEYNAKSCAAATAYVKRESENILPKWKQILANATQELADFEKKVKNNPAFQNDPTSDDDIEDEHIEDLKMGMQDESMDDFRKAYRSNADLTHNDDMKDVYADPNLLAFPYEDEQRNVQREMPNYKKNDASNIELRDDGFPENEGYFDRTSAKDMYANLRNNDAIRRRDERRFEDMKRLLQMRGPQPFNDDDIEDAPHMPWKK